MKTILAIDTETTGFPLNGSPIQPKQARVCQLGMILATEDKKIIGKFSSLIKPNDWTISEGAQNVHGISDIDCYQYGMDQEKVMETFIHFYTKADIVVAHNEKFDRRMMFIEGAYLYGENAQPLPEWRCTMNMCSYLPSKNLEAALLHYCNRYIDNAHDALEDAQACLDIYFAITQKG